MYLTGQLLKSIKLPFVQLTVQKKSEEISDKLMILYWTLMAAVLGLSEISLQTKFYKKMFSILVA